MFVDFEEIRAFVRRIKAIFEVPGVYYYVSLAEDTLTALYLGPAEGKNEIDSAFDHIVRIPPLDCDASEEIASEYLLSHGLTDLPPKLTRTLATVSFGVPRDIIRRCDELFAIGQKEVSPAYLVAELRALQLSLGYELKQISKAQTDCLNKAYAEAAAYAQEILNDEALTLTEQKLVLSIWLLSLVEAAVDRVDGKQWLQVTEKLCDIGYRVPVDPVADLQVEIKQIHSVVLENEDRPSVQKSEDP